MKRIFLGFSALLCLSLATGCNKENVETKSAPRTVKHQYTLIYTAGDNGSIDGINRQTVDQGSAGSTVTAVPVAGYHFAGWSDGSMVNPRTDFEVNSDLEVTASFARDQFTLTYIPGDHGSIAGATPQRVDPGGAGSTVTAVPAAGYHFVGWSDGIKTPDRTDAGLQANLSVIAGFAINQYTLTYTAGENGTIEGANRQTVDYGGAGKKVTGVPATGYHFVGWSDGSTANPRTDGDVTSGLTISASFAINQYTLTYSAEENGAIEGPGSQTVNHGGAASQVTAVADKGYHFVTWSDGVTSAERSDSNITGDISVNAIFAVNTYTVGGTLAGLAEGNAVVLQNNGADDLVVNRNGSFNFAKALPDGRPYAATVLTQPTSPNQTCSVTKGAGNISGKNVAGIEVNCITNTYSVGGTVFGLPEGDQLVLQNNKGDDLAVAANGAFTFERALEDGSGYEITIKSQTLHPKWFCRVDNGAGTLAGGNVNNVDVACFHQAELQAVAGNGKIDLNWNSQDFRGAVFNLCRAREEIPEGGFSRCEELKGGHLETKKRSPHILSGLVYDVPYWIQLEVQHPGGRRSYSEVVNATPYSALNDTGIDWCADSKTNFSMMGTHSDKDAGCKAVAANQPGQDAHQGRDAAARARKLTKSGGGSAGFDFTKVCMSGDLAGKGSCPPNPKVGSGADNWACTLDNVTGLIWEMKTDGGLHSQGNTYTWYDPNEALNGGAAGVQNGGHCTGSGCDTQAYVQVTNSKLLCGVGDWRLPTREELLSIVDNGRFKPSIDTDLFPNTSPSNFWSSSAYADQKSAAWQVDFQYGEVKSNDKGQGLHVRLVRKAK